MRLCQAILQVSYKAGVAFFSEDDIASIQTQAFDAVSPRHLNNSILNRTWRAHCDLSAAALLG